MPTPERQLSGVIDTEADAVTYDKTTGDVVRTPVYRAVDTIGLMFKRGSITAGMAKAATKYRADFIQGQNEGLRASDHERPVVDCRRVSWGEIEPTPEEARRRANEAILAVGGEWSFGGSIVYHVVGGEWSIKQWLELCGGNNFGLSKTLREERAFGILIGALSALKTHYNIDEPLPRQKRS
jgi:hypothetical protein